MNRRAIRGLLTSAGIVAFAFLLHQFGLSAILATVGRVRWALLFLLTLPAVTEIANAAGWRLCFPTGKGPPPSFATLLRLRLAGDGVNYLVPTATIGGELLRIDLLDPAHARADKASSVLLARLAQDLALAALAASGFSILACRTLAPSGSAVRIGLWFVPASAAFAAAVLAAGWRWTARADKESLAGRIRLRIEEPIANAIAQLRSQPARFAAAIAIFCGGYLWGTVEAFWICRLIDRPVSIGTALRIEILSLTIDAILFLVPARIGTQEAGTTLIFALLGLAARDGFAFGVIRHVRELFWAGLGLLMIAGRRKA